MAYKNIANSFYSNGGVNYDLQWDNATGLVQLIKQNAPAGTSPIFYDGHWVTGAINSLGIDPGAQQRIYNDIQSSVRTAYQNAGGAANGNKIPQWAALTNQGSTVGQQISTVPAQPSGFDLGAIIDALTKPGDAIMNLSSNKKDPNTGNYLYGPNNEKDLFKKPMVYPIDLEVDWQDTLVIRQFHYTPPNAGQLLTGNLPTIVGRGLTRGSATRKEDNVGIVYFPMPSSISEEKSVNWGGDTLNNLSAGALSSVAKNAGGLEIAGAAMAAGAAAANIAAKSRLGLNLGLDPLKTAQMGATGLVGANILSSASGTPEGKAAIGGIGLSQLTKMAGFAVPTETILSRGAGYVTNENLELLFSGPNLRVFSCSYRLTARSREEARMIKLIIRFFKQGMSPKKRSGAAGEPSVFLSTPNVFELKFMSGKKEIEGVSRFKTCALRNMQTDYTPDGFWSAYEAGQPISTRITLTFAELEPVYDTDYQEFTSGAREDLRPVTNTEIGY